MGAVLGRRDRGAMQRQLRARWSSCDRRVRWVWGKGKGKRVGATPRAQPGRRAEEAVRRRLTARRRVACGS
ncbi:UNVERIFIED_CONTAM: hypothetical protein Sradi_6888100 [Sesamum radiatum]|uniref:Uncharacterized protein n=1 Tax=Sesamum radiatum TaxID=300843 RepID=A0AAW2JJ00_SESRA